MTVHTRVTWHSRIAHDAASRGSVAAAAAGGEVVLRRADMYVPLDTGRLRSTGHVTAEASSEGAVAAVAYDTTYAAILHAHPGWEYQNGRDARWLERAAAESHEGAAQEMASAMRKHF